MLPVTSISRLRCDQLSSMRICSRTYCRRRSSIRFSCMHASPRSKNSPIRIGVDGWMDGWMNEYLSKKRKRWAAPSSVVRSLYETCATRRCLVSSQFENLQTSSFDNETPSFPFSLFARPVHLTHSQPIFRSADKALKFRLAKFEKSSTVILRGEKSCFCFFHTTRQKYRRWFDTAT